VENPRRERKKAVNNDPKRVAAARALRDRWMEEVNADGALLRGAGK
jgi:hypothetical protein